jgi:hypothetical protein
VVVPLDAEQEPLLALPGEVAPERVHRDADEQNLPVMTGLAPWRDQLSGIASDKIPTHGIPESMVQDPVQLHDRGGRESGPYQFAVELVEMPRPEPGQSHLSNVGNRVAPGELLVPDPGPRADRGLDAAKPGAEELLDRGALVTEDLPVPVCLERDGEPVGHLDLGLAMAGVPHMVPWPRAAGERAVSATSANSVPSATKPRARSWVSSVRCSWRFTIGAPLGVDA